MHRTWLDDIVQVLLEAGRDGLSLHEIEKQVMALGNNRNDTPRETISSVLETYSKDSKKWLEKNGLPDLFRSSRGIGQGYWALRDWPNKPDLSFQRFDPGNTAEEIAHQALLELLKNNRRKISDYNRNQVQEMVDQIRQSIPAIDDEARRRDDWGRQVSGKVKLPQ